MRGSITGRQWGERQRRLNVLILANQNQKILEWGAPHKAGQGVPGLDEACVAAMMTSISLSATC